MEVILYFDGHFSFLFLKVNITFPIAEKEYVLYI